MAANNSMFEYLDWRGDLTFEADPFNEVDNMILSQMAYVDYGGIVSESGDDKISIGDAARLFWELHTEEEIKNRTSFVNGAPYLLKPVAASRRFGKMMLSGYVNSVSKSDEAQMSAVQFELEDGTIYVAFRGTDENIIGWKEDFNLSYMSRTEGQRLAAEYLRKHFAGRNEKLRVGGHSKGGNFAIYASAFAGPDVMRQIRQIYCNDAPGFREEIMETPEYRSIKDRIIGIIPEDSIIGRLLGSDHTQAVVGSSASGILQHNAMTWKIRGRRFVRAKRSADSQFIEKVLSGWINSIDDEGRRAFADSVFDTMLGIGADTMKDVRNADMSDILEAIQTVRNMPKEQQKEFGQALRELFRSGEKTFYKELGSSEEKIPAFIKKWAAKRSEAIEKKEQESSAET